MTQNFIEQDIERSRDLVIKGIIIGGGFVGMLFLYLILIGKIV